MKNSALQKQDGYLIGDVSQIVGLSRDALRFYEKKGVITARKKDNGYRYYSEEDIYKLMYIFYHRKMNTSLDTLEGLMNGNNSLPSIRDHINRRMSEETHELRLHHQAITRLKLVEKDLERIERCLGSFSVRKFPHAFILNQCSCLQEGLKTWFHLASSIEGLDMTYFYTLHTYTGRSLSPEGTRLLLYKGLERELGDKFDPAIYPMTDEFACIYTVMEAQDTLPGVEMIREMIQWGKDQGLETDGRVYANNMTSFFDRDDAKYCLELYMPIK